MMARSKAFISFMTLHFMSIRSWISNGADWLTKYVFPRVVAYATPPFHITALLILGLLLESFANWTAFSLAGWNYTNVVSAAVSCIVLLQTTRLQQSHTAHTQSLADHREEIRKLVAQIDLLTDQLQMKVDETP